MSRGRTAEQLAHIRTKRRPFSDVREGRVLRQVRRALLVSESEEVTTSYLVSWCYPAAYVLGGVKSWRRTNTIKAARRVAIPIRRGAGKGAGKGYPLVWRPVPELMERRRQR